MSERPNPPPTDNKSQRAVRAPVDLSSASRAHPGEATSLLALRAAPPPARTSGSSAATHSASGALADAIRAGEAGPERAWISTLREFPDVLDHYDWREILGTDTPARAQILAGTGRFAYPLPIEPWQIEPLHELWRGLGTERRLHLTVEGDQFRRADLERFPGIDFTVRCRGYALEHLTCGNVIGADIRDISFVHEQSYGLRMALARLEHLTLRGGDPVSSPPVLTFPETSRVRHLTLLNGMDPTLDVRGGPLSQLETLKLGKCTSVSLPWLPTFDPDRRVKSIEVEGSELLTYWLADIARCRPELLIVRGWSVPRYLRDREFQGLEALAALTDPPTQVVISAAAGAQAVRVGAEGRSDGVAEGIARRLGDLRAMYPGNLVIEEPAAPSGWSAALARDRPRARFERPSAEALRDRLEQRRSRPFGDSNNLDVFQEFGRLPSDVSGLQLSPSASEARKLARHLADAGAQSVHLHLTSFPEKSLPGGIRLHVDVPADALSFARFPKEALASVVEVRINEPTVFGDDGAQIDHARSWRGVLPEMPSLTRLTVDDSELFAGLGAVPAGVHELWVGHGLRGRPLETMPTLTRALDRLTFTGLELSLGALRSIADGPAPKRLSLLDCKLPEDASEVLAAIRRTTRLEIASL